MFTGARAGFLLGVAVFILNGCTKPAAPQPKEAAAVQKPAARPKEAVAVQKPAALRIALVASQPQESVRTVVDLALAGLSANNDLELLERSAIERVLTEQKLSLSGLVDANRAVAAGKLLAVDLFAVVETAPGGKEALGLVVYDTKSGVRLGDVALPEGEANKVADGVAEEVRKAATKRADAAKKLRTVCLLGVRNADLPPVLNDFCDLVALMLERELVRSPTLAVLERRRLELVNRERGLPTRATPHALSASLVLLDLEVRRAPQGLQATAFLTDGKGKALTRFTAVVREAKPADLAAALYQPVSRFLEAAPAPRAGGDRTTESSRFLREAHLLCNHQYFLKGLQAVESAQALDPDHPDNQAALARYLLSYATYLLDPGGMTTIGYGNYRIQVEPANLKPSLELARRAVEVRALAWRRLPRDRRAFGLGPGWQLYITHGLRTYVNKFPHVDAKAFDAPARELHESFRAAVTQLLVEELQGYADAALTDPARPNDVGGRSFAAAVLSRYSQAMRERFEIMRWNAADAADYTRLMLKVVPPWLEVARHQEVDKIQYANLAWFLEDLTRGLAEPFGAPWTLGAGELKQMGEIFQAMASHPQPLIALYGRSGQLLVGLKTKQRTPVETLRQYQALKKQAFALIKDPPRLGGDAFRAGCYKMLAHTIERLAGACAGGNPFAPFDPARHQRDVAPLLDEFYELAEFMLGRQEVCTEALVTLSTYGGQSKSSQQKSLRYLERALAEGPPRRWLAEDKEWGKNALRTARDQILTHHPELAPPPTDLPWDNVRRLVDVVTLKDFQVLLCPTVVKDQVYVVGCGLHKDKPFIQLVRVPLGGGAPRVLGQAPVELKATLGSLSAGSWAVPRFITGCCPGDGMIYVGTRTSGIIAFDEKGGPGRPLDGLPSSKVEALALLEGNVFAALKGGYLVQVTPGKTNPRVLASSRRKEKSSPFDDAEAFYVRGLVADPQGRRLLFPLYQGTPSTAGSIDGLWEYSRKTRAFTRRVPLFRNPPVNWVSPVRQGQVLFSTPFWAFVFDLARNQPTFVSSRLIGPGLKPAPELVMTASPPHLLHKGWVWTSYPFGRTRTATGKVEKLPPLDKNTLSFAANEALELLADDRLLIGSPYGLWLARLRKE